MKSKLTLATLLMSVGLTAVILTSWKEYVPEPSCEELAIRNGKIAINFNAGPNQFRNSSFEYFVPNPDMRFGDTPGQNSLDQTNFVCSVSITSPNCSSFQFHRSFENPGNVIDVELPPIGYDITVKVKYIERGEDFNTTNFNKPTFGFGGNPLLYSRLNYEFQETFLGWPSNNVAQPIYLTPTYNEGYNIDPATGRIQTPPAGNKADLGDISGINSYIDLGI